MLVSLCYDLPCDHLELPWSHGLSVCLTDVLYFSFEKKKSRPGLELQIFGDPASSPTAAFELPLGSALRVDLVPKESVQFPFQKF